ncbi:Sugar-transfer associated ATP-grasp [Zobellia uliginosa]|uniref:Sugar-transfer associated ATP-grasp n=1 Tax=Zobellia uliginosa TaxID=143224 RepID=A0ABY1KJU0_9FLAO|nr:Sugar-transfer associated ATP-grasp [Zobellia uliginosa]
MDYRYHQISNTIARKALIEIEKDRGQLEPRLKKRADEYAIEILGWKGFSPWLHTYSALARDFKEGWIPDNYYGRVVIQQIQGSYGQISFLKPLSNKLLNKKVCPEVASFINGFWFDHNLRPIKNTQVYDVIFKNTNQVICKLDQSYQGRGIFRIEKEDFNLEQIEKKGNCVIQKFIEQHPIFDELISEAVATIRITTVIDSKNEISVRACYLRLGRINDTHVKSTNHIRVPLDIQNGKLYNVGYLSNWKSINHHPDSKARFNHITIPNYQDCVSLVLNLHKEMPMVQSIGWDLSVDKDSTPVLMEWNGYSNDIKFSEAIQGPCFKDLGWEKFSLKK